MVSGEDEALSDRYLLVFIEFARALSGNEVVVVV